MGGNIYWSNFHKLFKKHFISSLGEKEMIYIPILGALALASGTILQRKILRHKNVSVKQYFVWEFLAIILVMLPIVFFFWRVDHDAYKLKNILIFGAVIITAILANIFTFNSVKNEKINNLEPAKILEPLFVILLAIILSFFFLGFDRNPKVIVPAIISVLALLGSHIKKYHLKFNKYFIFAIIGSFFFALELIISKFILEFYNPITFYFVRGIFVTIIALLIFRPYLGGIPKKLRIHMVLIGIIWVVFRVITYWGYQKLGVVFTTLIMMLGPVFVYLFAHMYLKEKYNWKNIIASAVIVASIAYATIS